MGSLEVQVLSLWQDVDVTRVRRAVARVAEHVGLSVLDRTRMVTAASELARNALQHGGGGEVRVETLNQGRRGLRATFADRGPGIPDLDLALQDGYSTGRGLGLGLGGARRLCQDFTVDTAPGRGTTVTIAQWCS